MMARSARGAHGESSSARRRAQRRPSAWAGARSACRLPRRRRRSGTDRSARLTPTRPAPQASARDCSRRPAASVACTGYVWHGEPDGAATFVIPDGGWVLRRNSELNGTQRRRLARSASPRTASRPTAYRILSGTKWNCAGGATPWGTMALVRGVPQRAVWECDPFKPSQGVARPALGVRIHEAAPVHPATGFVYLTENDHDGRLYRFRPDHRGDLGSGRWRRRRSAGRRGVVVRGVAEAALPRARRHAVRSRQGAWISRDVLYFSTTPRIASGRWT